VSAWDQVAGEIVDAPRRRSRRRGTVTSFDVLSVPRQVFVDVGSSGVSVPMTYCRHYAPTIGDEVLIDWDDGDPIVIGQLW
jgi:ribosome maturation factor RimP